LDACFVNFEHEPGRRSVAKLLTKDEARRIAATPGEAAGAATSGVLIDPLRCLVLSLGEGDETALQSKQQTD
jgi:hypothetical protein